MTPAGQAALRAAAERQPREADYLIHFQNLEKTFHPSLAQAALETAILRREAQSKFPRLAEKMYFTRPALEQATPAEVAAYRAARLAGREPVLDLGCSIGGDLVHLAGQAQAYGVDHDPLRIHMARANLEALGLSAGLLRADLRATLPFMPPPGTAAFFDPARRSGHRRIFSVQDYKPPLSQAQAWLGRIPALCIKVSPGVDLGELADLDCEIEFISLHGELKEAALWFGPLMTAARRATVLPGPHSLTGDPAQRAALAPAPGAYLYEPDPAVLRAGLVGTLADHIGAAQLDETIAYLTSERRIESPFTRRWSVEDWMPFNLKKLRAYCRSRGIGRVAVKKRGSAIQPEDLIRSLRLQGELERVLVLTRLAGAPVVLVCRPSP